METKKPLLTELSFAFILPAIIYIVFASSSVWAAGNFLWTSFYEFFSEVGRVEIFNFWAGIIFLGGAIFAFAFALASLLQDVITNKSISKSEIFAFIISGSVMLLFLLFYSGVNIFSVALH